MSGASDDISADTRAKLARVAGYYDDGERALRSLLDAFRAGNSIVQEGGVLKEDFLNNQRFFFEKERGTRRAAFLPIYRLDRVLSWGMSAEDRRKRRTVRMCRRDPGSNIIFLPPIAR